MFVTHVERKIAIAHHNGPEGSRCYENHGHTVRVIVEFQFTEQSVDSSSWGWGPDFHEIKKVIERYDHKDLNETVVSPPSMENLARWVFNDLQAYLGRTPLFVEVQENGTPDQAVRYSK